MSVMRAARRRTGQTLAAVCIFAFLLALPILRHDFDRHRHYLASSGSTPSISQSMEDPSVFCRAHGFSAYRNPGRKVYDMILFSTELDMLEIRLHTLEPYVDYFVIIESPTTFTGLSKPLRLKENWSRFAAFHHKIIYRTIIDSIESARTWDHEDYLRNALLTGVFPTLAGTDQEPQYGDALLVSDIDEILRSTAMLTLRHCDFPARLKFRTDMYYYSFQWLYSAEAWMHPDATIYRGADTILPNTLRMNLLEPGWKPLSALRRWWDHGTLWNAGWHCSSCFATVAEMRVKMRSFSHKSLNTAQNRDAEVMIGRVRAGLDLFGREHLTYDRVETNTDLPTYILDEHQTRGRFEYLVDRDGQNAGFEDWKTVARLDE